MNYGLVWFKRDLRWQDHEALAQASTKGPVRCIYIVEPELWLQSDCALQHFAFIRESLVELDSYLRNNGGCIEIHTGEATEVFNKLWLEAPFSELYSHEETGNGFTYARDLHVAAWCQANGVVWKEFAQFLACSQYWLSRRYLFSSVCSRCLFAHFSLFNIRLHQHARSRSSDSQSPRPTPTSGEPSSCWVIGFYQSPVLALPFHSKVRERARD